jgi:hypothetical protein
VLSNLRAAHLGCNLFSRRDDDAPPEVAPRAPVVGSIPTGVDGRPAPDPARPDSGSLLLMLLLCQ